MDAIWKDIADDIVGNGNKGCGAIRGRAGKCGRESEIESDVRYTNPSPYHDYIAPWQRCCVRRLHHHWRCVTARTEPHGRTDVHTEGLLSNNKHGHGDSPTVDRHNRCRRIEGSVAGAKPCASADGEWKTDRTKPLTATLPA